MSKSKYARKNAFKIIICGDGAVGKTTISKRLIGKLNFDGTVENTSLTPGVDFHSLNIPYDGVVIDCQIWDLGGQDYFRGFQDDFFESATVVFFVCSVDRFTTLENLEKWMSLLTVPLEEIDKRFLIANKIDAPERALETDILMDFAEVFDLDYYEMSALKGYGFEEFQEELITSIKTIYQKIA